MRRTALISIAVVAALLPLASCISTPTRKSAATVRVAALTYPGGGAPPAILSMYKAALEVVRNNPDLDIKIVSVTPPQDPSMMKQAPQEPPTVTALEQALGQDPPPDVVLFSGIYEFYPSLQKELLQPLDNFMRSDRNVKMDDYFPGALEALKDRDRLYGLPIAVAPTVLMYDKRVFDEAGVPVPESNWDWSTFVGIAQQITKAKDDPQNDVYALNLLSGPMILPAFIWQNGGEMISKDGTRSELTEPATIEAIKFYYDLMHTYKVVPPYPKPTDKMAGVAIQKAVTVRSGEAPPLMGPTGRVAMQIVSGAGSTYAGYPYGGSSGTSPFRMVEMPRGKVQATIMDVQVAMAMTSRAQDGPLAYKAMMALTEEMQKDISIPARRSMAKNLRQINPNVAEQDVPVILNSLEYARALPPYAYSYGQSNVMSIMYEKLFNPLQQGTKSVEEAAKEASDAIDEVLNQQ